MAGAVLRPGDSVDSWCGKCKMMLAHTIEAMMGDKPARVHCNTCKAKHGYRPNKPGEGSRRRQAAEPAAGAAKAAPARRHSRFESMLEGKDMTLAKPYSPKDKYQPGDVLDHPMFGVGVAKALKDETKVEVLFKDGTKVLIQGR